MGVRIFFLFLHKLLSSMKLPIYKADSFNRIIEEGGHSKPWIVSVNINGILKPFVVKLYRTIDIAARNKMTAEILGNLLALEFDLTVPTSAIIEFTDDFRMGLKQEHEEILSLLDERNKFGTEYIAGTFLYSPQTPLEKAKEIIPIDTLYAYDYFICNRDRTLSKPNLLVRNENGILIDHEMALEIDKTTISNFENEIWNNKYQYHLFYNLLKQSSLTEKETYFNDFESYLQMLRFNKYDGIFEQLKEIGFDDLKEDDIKSYFLSIIQSPQQFINILKKSIE